MNLGASQEVHLLSPDPEQVKQVALHGSQVLVVLLAYLPAEQVVLQMYFL
jgi:hypothetical protein